MVAGRPFDAPLLGALEENAVDLVLGPPDESIGHYSRLAVLRLRKRSIVC